MNASGLFFLRRRICSAVTSSGQRSVLLPLCERVPSASAPAAEVRHVTALWTGSAAERFVDAHGQHLQAGCALKLSLANLRSIHNEIHADVLACELAPDRWAKSDGKGPEALVHGSVRAMQPVAH